LSLAWIRSLIGIRAGKDSMIATSVHISRRNHPKLKTQNPKLKTVKEAYLGG